MPISRSLLLVLTVAGAGLLTGPALAKDPSAAKKPLPQLGGLDASGTYQLSAEEQGYDCKKLLGTMQIRIMQLREYDPSKKTSELSRQLQKVTEPAFSIMHGKASTYSADPDKRYRTDRAMLEAYNRQAAAKGCKVYDLEAELKPGKGPADLPVARAPQAAPATKPATPPAK